MPKQAGASNDATLWRRVTRDVKPLAPRSELPQSRQSPVGKVLATAQPRPVPAPTSHPIKLDRFAGIDRANAERLKRGKHKVEARLDLHGMTQGEAHRALLGFIHAARASGKRCILVITGQGRPMGPNGGGGILKAAVPRWLDEPEFRPHLLAIATAQPRDGGAGALYVMLRRNVTAVVR